MAIATLHLLFNMASGSATGAVSCVIWQIIVTVIIDQFRDQAQFSWRSTFHERSAVFRKVPIQLSARMHTALSVQLCKLRSSGNIFASVLKSVLCEPHRQPRVLILDMQFVKAYHSHSLWVIGSYISAKKKYLKYPKGRTEKDECFPCQLACELCKSFHPVREQREKNHRLYLGLGLNPSGAEPTSCRGSCSARAILNDWHNFWQHSEKRTRSKSSCDRWRLNFNEKLLKRSTFHLLWTLTV